MKIKLLLILLIFGNAIYSSAYAVVAGGMAVVHRNWPIISGGYNSMEFTITITAEPGFNGRTFWAHEWGFIGKREGGYLDLQSRNANMKAVNFSIWGALGWQAAQGTYCRFFTHEGSGVQCDVEYQWEEGVTYKLRINNSANNAWKATIHDTKRNQTRTIATINVPPSYSGVYRLAEWVENFAQGSEQHPSCDVVPKAIAVFGTPTVNNSIPPTRSITYTYGNCQRIARSVCSTEQICTLSVNPEPPTIRKQIRNAAHGFVSIY